MKIEDHEGMLHHVLPMDVNPRDVTEELASSPCERCGRALSDHTAFRIRWERDEPTERHPGSPK